jgi:hypothetical protein
MKKAQTIITKAIAVLFLAAFSVTANANGGAKSSTELKANVNYVGATADGVLFKLAFANEAGKKFIVKVTDASGDVLYVNSFKNKQFEQTFKAPKDLASSLTFQIVADKKVYEQSFNIEKKLVEEVVVSNN